ncbi:winged helix DNA-binding domain-containing protein [Streptomyces sp. Ru87]|uniref:winged helix DNA-binding domain-containing protein n=1 Tax=Streptomyces sp. Ru87 TaxID=2044307 RepID=UPI000BF6C486|nr:winged helix DNA-binding domain-containing protein [Streptomyces sp. Ru87]PGH48755.1 hypothetical protein CRI70_21440 [Streptomyces sp. Ru87]
MSHSPSAGRDPVTAGAPAPPRLPWDGVLARRLARHGLAGPLRDSGPADCAGVLCGAHAQVMSAAELSLGLRLDGVTRDAVRTALWEERSLVKTFGPRGTVHLLPAAELPLWTGALTALPTGRNALSPGARLTPGQTDAVVAAVADALRDAELTADELTEAVVAAAGPWAGDLVMPAFQGMWPRWRQALHTAAHRGALCFGPNRGRKVTYTSPQRWLPGFRPAAPADSLARVVSRYLHAYGPATPGHFARWTAVPPGWAADLFGTLAASGAVEPVEFCGERAWVTAGDTALPGGPPRGVRLLPYFDAYTVGSHPRARVFPGRSAGRALARGQAGNFPVLLVDGLAAGVWHQRRSGRRIDITVEPLGPLSAAHRRELDEQAERTASVLGGVPRLTTGPVSAGPHA